MIWKPALLVAIKRARMAGMLIDDIADLAEVTADEVQLALDALNGRNCDQAAVHLNAGEPLAIGLPAAAAAPAPVKAEAIGRPAVVETRPPAPAEAPKGPPPADSSAYRSQPPLDLRRDDDLVALTRQAGGFGRLQQKSPPARMTNRPPFSGSIGKGGGVCFPKREAGAGVAGRSFRTIQPISDQVLGWARRMRTPLRSGNKPWPLAEIAALFDVSVEGLSVGLGIEAGQ